MKENYLFPIEFGLKQQRVLRQGMTICLSMQIQLSFHKLEKYPCVAQKQMTLISDISM